MKKITKKQIIIIVSILIALITVTIVGIVLLRNEPQTEQKEEPTIPTVNVEKEEEKESENEEVSEEQEVEEKIEEEKEEPQKEEIKKEKTYTITFDTAGGSKVSSQTVTEKQKASKPAPPTKNGYSFENWYFNDKVYDFNLPVTQNIKLVAKWKQNEITATGLSLDQKKYYMFTGDNVRVNATISPSNVTNKNIEWKSSDSSIASVTNGVVLAHKAGKATIIATIGTKTSIMEVHVLERCGSGCFRAYWGNYYNDTKTLEVKENSYQDFYNLDDFGYGAAGSCKLDGTKYQWMEQGILISQGANGIKFNHEHKFMDQIVVTTFELCENITE